MKNLIKLLGSLSFALALLGTLVILLTVSTLMESAYGTPFAQRLFYRAGWFDIFLGLVAVNILFSALSRWPYKLHHTGFLITHAGILLLLAGSLLTRIAGIEGQMALPEGARNGRMLLEEYELTLRERGKSPQTWALDSFSRRSPTALEIGGPGRVLTIERIEDNALLTSEIKDGGPESPKNRAVRFTLKSQMANLNETVWLIEKSIDPSFSSRLSMGLAQLELKEGRVRPAAASDAEPKLRITHKKNGKTFELPLQSGEVKDGISKELGLRVSEVSYFPDARVDEENRLVNESDAPKNPAVRFTLDDGKGQKEKRVLFTLFPDFESMHGRRNAAFEDLRVELLAPRSELADAPGSGLTFYFSKEGWSYESRSKKGMLTGEVKAGSEQPTGWMDFTFRVEEILEHASVERNFVPGNSQKGDKAALVSLKEDGKGAEAQWASPGLPAVFETEEGQVGVSVGAKNFELPFRLALVDFRKEDYPGTQSAAAYESDVVLEDAAERLTIQRTIWMNHPLDHKGYRIFQSSYIQDPETGAETSVFTIAKNPGIPFIYSGAVILFIGVVCVFYVKPLSYLSARSSHAAKK